MHFVKKHSYLILIILGSIIWSLTMVKSGLMYQFGMGFWGANGHDGIWHLAIGRSLAGGNLVMPVFAGELIQNYHLGFDLFLAGLHLITKIPLSILYFQILPPLIAVSLGLSLYLLVRHWRGSNKVALLSLFFVYFGGNWGWLVNLFRNGSIGGESMFWSQQSISTLINPPYALSLVLFSLSTLFLHRFLLSRNPKFFWTCAVLFGLLPLIKVYAGLLSLAGLTVVSIYDLVKNSRRDGLKLLLVVAAISLLVFLPFNKNSAGLIVFQPFWFLDSMLAVSDRFNWPRLFSALTTYRQSGNLLKLIPGYSLAFVIFLVGNFGTRVIGLNIFKSVKKFGPIEYFLSTVFLAGIFVPTFFIQYGTSWNTIQFFYYSLFVMNIFAAISFFDLTKRLKKKSLIVIPLLAICLFTLPTTIDSLKHYLPARPPAMISNEELEALKFLSQQPPGVVLEYPISVDPYAPAPRPLYLYESTAYVSAFSGHASYLADTVNLNITGYNWPSRQRLATEFMGQASSSAALEFIAQNQINYIYLADVAKYRPVLSASQLNGEIIFENSKVSVWAVGKY